jgi:hypothetical protein
MQRYNNDAAPHTAVWWFRWEIHEKQPDGQLTGMIKDFKEYGGGINYNNRAEAKEQIEKLIEQLKEILKS